MKITSLEMALKNPLLVKELPSGVNLVEFSKHLAQFKNIEILPLSYNVNQPIKDWSEFKALKSVGFLYYRNQEAALQILLNQLSTAPNLEKLNFDNLTFKTELLDLSQFEKITNIDLSYNHNLDIDKAMNQLVRQTPNLTHLNLRNMKIEKIPMSLFELKKLKSVDLTTNHFYELPTEFTEMPDLQEVILGAKNNYRVPKDLEKLFKDFPQLPIADRKFQLNLGIKRPKEETWSLENHRLPLFNALNSILPRIRNKSLTILENLFAQNYDVTKISTDSRVVLVGKMQGSKTDYKEKLKAMDSIVETKITAATTHIVLGEKPAKKVVEMVDLSAIFLTELQLNQFLESADQLFLVEKDSEPLAENLAALLNSADETNEEMAINLMKKGGVPKEAMNDLYLTYQFSTSEKNRRNAGKLLKQYGSPTLRGRLISKYSPKKSHYPASTITLLCRDTELTAFDIIYGMFRRTAHYGTKDFLLKNGTPEIIMEVLKSLIARNGCLTMNQPIENYMEYLQKLPDYKGISLKIMGDYKEHQFPAAVKSLTHLEEIVVNRLSDSGQLIFPEDVFDGLNQLVSIELNRCYINSFPLVLTRIRTLKRLNLRQNYLRELPVEMLNLQNLESLNLTYNKLEEFPHFLTQLPNLKIVQLGAMRDMKNVPNTLPLGWRM